MTDAPPAQTAGWRSLPPVLLVWLGSLFVLSRLGTMLMPVMVDRGHYLLLVALSPRFTYMLLAAPFVEPVPLLTLLAARRTLGIAMGYYAGSHYGEAAIVIVEQRFARTARLLRRIEGLFHRAAMPVLFAWPGFVTSLFAGILPMPVFRYVAVVFAGNLAWAALVHRLAEPLSPLLTWLTGMIGEYVVPLTVASFFFVLLYEWSRRRRNLRELQAAQSDLEA